MQYFFFDSSDSLLRVLVSVPVLYFAVVGFVRLSGKRSTSQMNNFDWIVTVAMGSLVGSGIILEDVKLVEVCLAIALLLSLQFLVTRLIISSTYVSRLVKAKPALLLFEGQLLQDAMRSERVSEAEIHAAVRARGIADMHDVAAVILETDASISVLTADSLDCSAPEEASSCSLVAGWPTKPDNA